ncbi:hypothetical protein GCM10010451_38760 [Streptomyces virens]|uniref:4Fe-4S ferredoxin-type domain-containing protein n=1 Tax=Streptomyces virens TaxID=285572 RepID=A0ABP6PQJ1_9ACTN
MCFGDEECQGSFLASGGCVMACPQQIESGCRSMCTTGTTHAGGEGSREAVEHLDGLTGAVPEEAAEPVWTAIGRRIARDGD